MADKQWYDFAIVSHFGETDREGKYWQPDANLAVPFEYPVISIVSGVVTWKEYTDWGQWVLTIRLDVPLNRLATHMFFEHMSSIYVGVGERVSKGTTLGLTGTAAVNILLGVGLYSGDKYGSGSAWTILQNDLKPGGAHLLDPTPLIESVRNGTIIQGETSPSSGTNDLLYQTGTYLAKDVFHLPETLVSAFDPNIFRLIGGVVYAAAVSIVALLFFILTGV
jgi:hypothetical protein